MPNKIRKKTKIFVIYNLLITFLCLFAAVSLVSVHNMKWWKHYEHGNIAETN